MSTVEAVVGLVTAKVILMMLLEVMVKIVIVG